MEYNSFFYKKTGHKVGQDPIPEYPEVIENLLIKCYRALEKNSPKALALIKGAIRKYPTIESLYDLLFFCYATKDKLAKAHETMLLQVARFPDSKSVQLTYCSHLIDQEQFEEVDKILGKERDAWKFCGKEIAAESIFKNYCLTVIQYEQAHGKNLERATEAHRLLFEFNAHEDITIDGGQQVVLLEMELELEKLDNRLKVVSFPTVDYKWTKEPPRIKHDEVNALFKYELYDLPKKDFDALMLIPRESLIKDLVNIVENCIERYETYEAEELLSEDYLDYSFLPNALFLLAGLNAKDQLYLIFDLFNQGEEFLDFWFPEDFDEIFVQVLFPFAKDNLEMFKAYVQEPHQYFSPRATVVYSVVQIALHYPERRQEVIDWLVDHFDFILKNIADKSLTDHSFIALSILYAVELRANEIIPTIQKLWDLGFVDTLIEKDIELVDLPLDPASIWPMPENAWEYFTPIDLRERAPSNLSFDIKNKTPISAHEEFLQQIKIQIMSGEADFDDDFPYQLPSLESDPKYSYSDSNTGYSAPTEAPMLRVEKKVGRNDPCPCGSGKKYKKCCM